MPVFFSPLQASRRGGALAASSIAANGGSARFLVLPESQNQWLIMRHGSFDVNPAAIGVKPTDQTWHFEQWLHLKIVLRKRRGGASPADLNSWCRISFAPSYHVRLASRRCEVCTSPLWCDWRPTRWGNLPCAFSCVAVAVRA